MDAISDAMKSADLEAAASLMCLLAVKDPDSAQAISDFVKLAAAGRLDGYRPVNYSTTIPASRTVGECQQVLADAELPPWP